MKSYYKTLLNAECVPVVSDLEWHNIYNIIIIALILFFSPNLIALQADYVTVVEDVHKISSPSPILPLLAKTNAPCSSVSLR